MSPLFLLIAFLLGGCARKQYISKGQKAGESLLWEKKFDEAIEAFKKAIHEAEKEGDKREVAHLKSLLGCTYAKACGSEPALFYARLAVVSSKSINYRENFCFYLFTLKPKGRGYKDNIRLVG